MKYYEYFLTVWEPSGEMDGDRPRIEPKEVKRFSTALEAWQDVVENKVITYTLHRAECVIDETFPDRWRGWLKKEKEALENLVVRIDMG